jgi:hypothetical protein
MYHYVYRITNKVLNKHYYGKRSSNIPPYQDLGIKYFSSSYDRSFRTDQKSNPQDYKYKVIRMYESSTEALAMEIKLHNKFDVARNKSFYNMAKQTSTGCDCTGSTRVISEAQRALLSEIHKGKTISEEQRKKISESLKGRPSPNKGNKYSEEAKKLISERNKGANNPNYGVKASPEKLKKMSEAASGIKNPNAKPANIYDYETKSVIAENVVIKEWCRSNNYSPSSLSKTANADLDKPHHCTKNVHRHKGVFARYL